MLWSGRARLLLSVHSTPDLTTQSARLHLLKEFKKLEIRSKSEMAIASVRDNEKISYVTAPKQSPSIIQYDDCSIQVRASHGIVVTLAVLRATYVLSLLSVLRLARHLRLSRVGLKWPSRLRRGDGRGRAELSLAWGNTKIATK